ncbi:hypothetical protein RFI_05004 [Reticulomyxa filosa]|uniref:Uncharacterized protein n=1 Tax=Reticulomyxa filosa TaxID=46433 RepID=X6P3G8_RETFI|nr:hypothetical protein RFI_05004 [Reticulomyxa filosa]|eukprot:ETO32112.1 hypothetical protein RFI_05004 [Reticulomyxa filosa]
MNRSNDEKSLGGVKKSEEEAEVNENEHEDENEKEDKDDKPKMNAQESMVVNFVAVAVDDRKTNFVIEVVTIVARRRYTQHLRKHNNRKVNSRSGGKEEVVKYIGDITDLELDTLNTYVTMEQREEKNILRPMYVVAISRKRVSFSSSNFFGEAIGLENLKYDLPIETIKIRQSHNMCEGETYVTEINMWTRESIKAEEERTMRFSVKHGHSITCPRFNITANLLPEWMGQEQ